MNSDGSTLGRNDIFLREIYTQYYGGGTTIVTLLFIFV